MSVKEFQIPIPPGAIKVEVPGHNGIFFINPDIVASEVTWAADSSKTFGASYVYGPDEIIVTQHSHIPEINGKKIIFDSSSPEFWKRHGDFQRMLNIIDAKSEQESV